MKNIVKFLEDSEYENKTELCSIMNECGSDKGNGHHNYTTLYDFLWGDIKSKIKNVFEVGVGTTTPGFTHGMGPDGTVGASLYGWEKYFPNANIYSCDIDKDCLFQTDRIKTYYCDQRKSGNVQNIFNEIGCDDFDIIIVIYFMVLIFFINFFNLLPVRYLYVVCINPFFPFNECCVFQSNFRITIFIHIGLRIIVNKYT